MPITIGQGVSSTSTGVNTQILRPTGARNVKPNALEIPNPKDGDTATVVIDKVGIEYYLRDSGAWVMHGDVTSAAATTPGTSVTFDNTITALPNAPATVQDAIKELDTLIASLGGASNAGETLSRPDLDMLLKNQNADGSERITLINAGDAIALPAGSTGLLFRAVVPSGTGSYTVAGVTYSVVATAQSLVWYWDTTSNSFKVVGALSAPVTPGTPVATTEVVTMASLPADVWTDIPIGLTILNPSDIVIATTIQPLRRRNADKWQLASSIAMTNLLITLQA